MEKRLYRIKNNQTQLGGVAQGLSEYFNIDLTLVRILFVILFFTPVPSFLTYLILWAILPEKESYGSETFIDNSINQPSNFSIMSQQSKNGNLVGGAVLIILGIIFSFRTFFDINLFSYLGKLWPLILVGLGVWMIVRDKPSGNNFGE